MENFQICCKCFIKKELKEFSPHKGTKLGIQPRCKPCRALDRKEWISENKEQHRLNKKKEYRENIIKIKERRKIYYQNNRGEIIKSQKRHYLINIEKIKIQRKIYAQNNKNKISERAKKYYSSSRAREKRRIRARNYEKTVLKFNLNYRIKKLLQSRILNVLNGRKKSDRTVALLGCSIPDFIKYIESKFTKGMTWENRGFYGWHIDHIIPCDYFKDLSDPEQQKKCFHYTNLQPLWATEEIARKYESADKIFNLNKGSKIICMSSETL